VTDPRARLVADGYDTMHDAWEEFRARVHDDPRLEWLDELVARTPAGSAVVELGSGNGTVETQRLAERYELVAVDLSEEQLRRARLRVPGARFVHADLLTVGFEPESVDAVAAFYVFNHVPRELLAELFARIGSWLRPGGHVLATLGSIDLPGWHGSWLGVPMFFSSFTPDRNRQLIERAGLTLVRDEVVTIAEPDGPVPFHWILAQR
jgi:SAM-dependent methyltransferase